MSETYLIDSFQNVDTGVTLSEEIIRDTERMLETRRLETWRRWSIVNGMLVVLGVIGTVLTIHTGIGPFAAAGGSFTVLMAGLFLYNLPRIQTAWRTK